MEGAPQHLSSMAAELTTAFFVNTMRHQQQNKDIDLEDPQSKGKILDEVFAVYNEMRKQVLGNAKIF